MAAPSFSRRSTIGILGGVLATPFLNIPAASARTVGTPFRIDVADDKLDRIRRTVAVARLPRPMPEENSMPGSRGMDVRWLGEFQDYWINGYDWRHTESALNRLPQFTEEIDGQTLHFLHIEGKGPDPKPVLLAHGWPYSNFSFVDVVDRLTDPVRFGGSEAEALTLVVPAQPGYGFSPNPDAVVGVDYAAALYRTLMVERLGYPTFGIQGGDQGSVLGRIMADRFPRHISGLHLNLAPTRSVAPADQTEEERAWGEGAMAFQQAEMSYFGAQVAKPLMINAAVSSNVFSVGAWIAEKFWSWADHPGNLDVVISKKRLLDEIMIYAVTDTFDTSIWSYNALRFIPFASGGFIETPTGVYLSEKEFPIGTPPRTTLERDYNLVHETRPQLGGHFPFIEQPDGFAKDILSFFASLK